jgi:glycine betaine/choline ABC-type transport system substrate-binding protein
VIPVVSEQTLERFPGMADALNAISALLRTSDLREMNAATAAGRSAAAVAGGWLRANGFSVAPG